MYSFVALGLPDGMIGTAWPVLRRGFGAPLADLGIVLLVGTLGSLASSSVSGLLLRRLGVAGTLVLAGTSGTLGILGATISPTFWVFVISGTAIGAAAGLLDSAMNTSMALAGRNRLLNMLHGCYCVGTSAGPLVVTAALLAGSWRPAYAVALVVEVVLTAGWWTVGSRSSRAVPAEGAVPAGAVPVPTEVPVPDRGGGPGAVPGPAGSAGPPGRAAVRSRARSGLVIGLGLIVFMLYTGFEVSAGQWEPSFDRGLLHLGAGATGLATFGYWGAMTLARFALAVPRRPLSPMTIVRWGCAVGLAGAVLVWWCPVDAAAPIGLVIIGGGLAGVFPALVTLTPSRVGDDMAQHAIGWQIGAAGLGGSGISALFGVALQRYGLACFGPALVTVAVLSIMGILALERASTRGAAR
jgi:fucose permease